MAQLARLARGFSVSEEAMMLRLVTLGVAEWAAYHARRDAFSAGGDGEKSSGATHHRVVLARHGTRYSRLVLEAYHRGILTGHRASTYLGTRVSGLEKIGVDLLRRELARAS